MQKRAVYLAEILNVTTDHLLIEDRWRQPLHAAENILSEHLNLVNGLNEDEFGSPPPRHPRPRCQKPPTHPRRRTQLNLRSASPRLSTRLRQLPIERSEESALLVVLTLVLVNHHWPGNHISGLVLSFIDALVTKTRLKALTGGIS